MAKILLKEEHRYLDSEEIERKQKELEKQIEELKKVKSSLGLAKRGKSNDERQRSAIFGNYIKSKHKNVYDNYVKGDEFNEYLNRNKDRLLFGLTPLETFAILDEHKKIAEEMGSFQQEKNMYSAPLGHEAATFYEEVKKKYKMNVEENVIKEDNADSSSETTAV